MTRPLWKLAQPDPELTAQFSRDLGFPPLFSKCLANRGCATLANAREYLEPRLARLGDPFELPAMDRAVERLLKAHAEEECFVIFGDYDVDGVTATALLVEFFANFGWKCFYYLPHRVDEGYGLSREGIRNCLQKHSVRLVLAVDCGSSATEVIAELRAEQIEVIVVDHHQVSVPEPPTAALVNPQVHSGDSPLKNLCSAGLAFKLAHALLKRIRSLGWAKAFDYDLREFLDLVALGTIADLVPLQGENRIFARAGLERLATTARPGLQALKEVSGLASSVQSHEVAFQLAPRLNAAGRLETALDSLELLLTRDERRAAALAEALDAQNRERQTVEQHIGEEVIAAIRARFNPQTDFAIVEGHAAWHIGVVGIVASRVLREFHRPVVILGGDGSDHWRGSGRSIEGFDLARGLRECADLLLKHGGHAMAAGVTLSALEVDRFRARLNQVVQARVSADALQPALTMDGEVHLSELTFPALKLLEKLAPIGQGNPPVQLAARGLGLRGEPKKVGEKHLRFAVTDGRTIQQAIWWNAPAHDVPERFDLAFTPELNEYNGTFGIQLKVLDLRASKI